MNTQYRHRNCDRAFYPATFCMDVPSAGAFQDSIFHGDPYIKFNFGMTYLHPNDQYSKELGRFHSLSSMTLTSFHIKRIELKKGRIFFFLFPVDSGNKENDIYEIAISSSFLDDNVRFEWVDFNCDNY